MNFTPWLGYQCQKPNLDRMLISHWIGREAWVFPYSISPNQPRRGGTTTATVRTSSSSIQNPSSSPNPMTENTSVAKWVDLTTICNHFGYSNERVGNIARIKFRYVGADTIEFEIDGATIRKVGKGRLARYRIISNPHRL